MNFDFFYCTSTVWGFVMLIYLYFKIQTDLKRLKKELPWREWTQMTGCYWRGRLAVRLMGRWSPFVVCIILICRTMQDTLQQSLQRDITIKNWSTQNLTKQSQVIEKNNINNWFILLIVPCPNQFFTLPNKLWSFIRAFCVTFKWNIYWWKPHTE